MSDTPAASLLAKMIEKPSRNRKEYLDKGIHGMAERKARSVIGSLDEKEPYRIYYPNFLRMGFTAQAFVDITLTSSNEYKILKAINEISEENFDSIDEYVKYTLNQITGVILLYTVFGKVDLRCKVVGKDLRHLERIVMSIRKILGVGNAETHIIIDETDYDISRESWSRLIIENSLYVEGYLKIDVDDAKIIDGEDYDDD